MVNLKPEEFGLEVPSNVSENGFSRKYGRVKNGQIAVDQYNDNPKDIKDIEW